MNKENVHIPVRNKKEVVTVRKNLKLLMNATGNQYSTRVRNNPKTGQYLSVSIVKP